ncbi:MAG: hypothetical protein M3357_08055 [Actinomycetota bacterium]|nr:hypothetical protein [Actinomycetota bacterium]
MVVSLWVAVLTLMAACGDEGNGNEDTLLTGFSGVLILAIVIFLIVRSMKKRA